MTTATPAPSILAPRPRSTAVSRRGAGYRSHGTTGAVRMGLAADPRGDFDAGGAATAAVVRPVADAVARLAAFDPDAYSSEDLGRTAAALQTEIDRLTVLRDRIAGTLRRRAVVEAGPGRERAAVLRATRELGDRLGLAPSEAKQAADRGRTLDARPQLATALTGGPAPDHGGPDPDGTPGTGDASDLSGGVTGGRSLRPDQIALIGRTLDEVPIEHQDRVEATLIAAAATQHATELGRTARRLLAELDAAAANRAEERRHARRTASVCQTEDGMLAVSGRFSGLDAETVRTAIGAFSTPDVAGEAPRTPGQRTADALVAALRAALDAGSAPADRQVRPHLLVTVSLAELERALQDGSGVADLAWSGPVPAAQIRRLVSEATIHVLGLDVRGLPIAMSQAVNQPSAALYLALTVRDGGCRYPGCDAPPSWCDVAHATARRHEGPLTLDNCLLLCRRHHRRIDLGDWTIRIDGWDADFTAPNGRVLPAGPARGRPPDPP